MDDSLNETCSDAVADAVADAIENTELNASYASDAANFVNAIVLNFLLLSLLSDRLTGLKHKPTAVTFAIAIGTNLCSCVLGITGDMVDSIWDTNTSTIAFLFIRGFFDGINQASNAMLLYLRVADSLRRVLAAVNIWVNPDYNPDAQLYVPGLLYAAPAYRALLDIGFSAFSWNIIRQVSNNSCEPIKTHRKMTEANAFLLGYSARFLLFVGVDAILASTLVLNPDDSVVTFPVLSMWALLRLTVPTKPYLLLTDISRIRALSEDTPSAGSKTGPSDRKGANGGATPVSISRTQRGDSDVGSGQA
ncbi:hypothetical protein HKX48_006145 [Thoreauomyces humboldtii]|nr:hypothetical protein HKX48_006145 [Thoreauomyces humboldtii]